MPTVPPGPARDRMGGRCLPHPLLQPPTGPEPQLLSPRRGRPSRTGRSLPSGRWSGTEESQQPAMVFHVGVGGRSRGSPARPLVHLQAVYDGSSHQDAPGHTKARFAVLIQARRATVVLPSSSPSSSPKSPAPTALPPMQMPPTCLAAASALSPLSLTTRPPRIEVRVSQMLPFQRNHGIAHRTVAFATRTRVAVPPRAAAAGRQLSPWGPSDPSNPSPPLMVLTSPSDVAWCCEVSFARKPQTHTSASVFESSASGPRWSIKSSVNSLACDCIYRESREPGENPVYISPSQF